MSGVERTVRMGSMAYVDPDGKTRRADCGAVVQLHPDHLERFDRLNKPQVQEPAPVAAPAEAEPGPDLGGVPSDSWTVAQLQAFAKANDIDLGEATKKADILTAVQAATGKES